ncbi:MAG: patatin-like phospholipase family protein [Clostridia bacterium]|nr:patatin-like phospholipase family protein [Clostridia bacterium]
MSFGIALAGGGAKGAVHVGVLTALTEHNLIPTSIAGTSAGSIVAGLYAMGFTPQQLKELVHSLSRNNITLLDPCYPEIIKTFVQFMTRSSVSLSGFLHGNKLENYLCKLTKNQAIKDIKMPLVIPCVDLINGKTIVYSNQANRCKNSKTVEWRNDGQLCQIMRASCSIPAIFQPKILHKMCLVDGGVTDVLPVDLLREIGEKNVLAVDISEEYERPKSINIIEVTTHAFEIMQKCLKSHTTGNEKYRLTPKLPKDAGLLNFRQMDACVTAGYQATIAVMPKLKELFRK